MVSDPGTKDFEKTSDPEIRRARIRTLTIYEVSDSELLTLERGSPHSMYLNFALSLFSMAISFLITLLTVPIPSEKKYVCFLLLVIVGFVAGSILIAVWFTTRRSMSQLVRTIRQRLHSEGQGEPLTKASGLIFDEEKRLEIIEAYYGLPERKIDVTSELRKLVRNNTLRVVASNDIAGDPAPNHIKSLTIRYKIGGNEYCSEFSEGDEVVLPLRQ